LYGGFGFKPIYAAFHAAEGFVERNIELVAGSVHLRHLLLSAFSLVRIELFGSVE
jgi:hypothetical protein